MKRIRQDKIVELLEEKDFLKVAEAAELLNVTEMTIRRDLIELEKEGRVVRVHGGAKKPEENGPSYQELSHVEKQTMHIEEKKSIAKKAAELIEYNDTVFIGAGTTTELIYDYLNVSSAKIITNSISIFNRFRNDPRFDLILIGGILRERTGTFIGYFTRKWIQDIKVQKAFIGTNGIKDEHITTAEEEEGVIQQIVLGNSDEKYVLADSSKFGVEAFQVICDIDMITAIITDNKLPEDYEAYYNEKCSIIN